MATIAPDLPLAERHKGRHFLPDLDNNRRCVQCASPTPGEVSAGYGDAPRGGTQRLEGRPPLSHRRWPVGRVLGTETGLTGAGAGAGDEFINLIG